MAKERVGALLVLSDAIFNSHRTRLADLAARSRLPAAYGVRESVEAGGLMSYGPSFLDLYRRSAAYVDKILKGAKPADLPVEQPTKFELVINLKTAKALGLDNSADAARARRRGDRMRRRRVHRAPCEPPPRRASRSRRSGRRLRASAISAWLPPRASRRVSRRCAPACATRLRGRQKPEPRVPLGGEPDQMPELAAELVRAGVDVIVALPRRKRRPRSARPRRCLSCSRAMPTQLASVMWRASRDLAAMPPA